MSDGASSNEAQGQEGAERLSVVLAKIHASMVNQLDHFATLEDLYASLLSELGALRVSHQLNKERVEIVFNAIDNALASTSGRAARKRKKKPVARKR